MDTCVHGHGKTRVENPCPQCEDEAIIAAQAAEIERLRAVLDKIIALMPPFRAQRLEWAMVGSQAVQIAREARK